VDQASDQPDRAFSWRAHPAAEHRGRAALAAVAVLAVAAAAAAFAGSAWWGLFALVVLVVALNRFYFPSRFTIDDDGITAAYPLRTRRCPWTELRRFVHDEAGGYLSRRIRPSRLDAFGGMHVLFGGQRELIIDRIRRLMAREGRPCSG
jgi:hypothetical protein